MIFHWGKGILVFFIIFLSLCAIFIVFSLRQHHDLVVDDYYEQGAGYSTQMDVIHRSKPFKDSIQIKQEDQLIRFYLSKSIVSASDSIEIYFYRSSDKSLDVSLKHELISSPIELNSQLFQHGRYKVKVAWKVNEQRFEIQETIDLN